MLMSYTAYKMDLPLHIGVLKLRVHLRCRTATNVRWLQPKTELSLKCKYKLSSKIAVSVFQQSAFVMSTSLP